MGDDINKSLLELFLPSGILEYFTVVDFETKSSGQHVYDKKLTMYLEEKKIIPDEYKNYPYKASGFMVPREINDYPIRNMLVTLSVKRRRWDVVIDGQTQKVSRDWQLVSQGTRMSDEYAAFLKEISRY